MSVAALAAHVRKCVIFSAVPMTPMETVWLFGWPSCGLAVEEEAILGMVADLPVPEFQFGFGNVQDLQRFLR